MARKLDIEIQNLGNQRKIPELQELLNKTPAKELVAVLSKGISGSGGISLWSNLLLGFSKNTDRAAVDKRFACVKAVLKELSSVELNHKQTYEIVTRLFLDLPDFTPDQLVDIVEISMDMLKIGDPKCAGWKDLLPEAIEILVNMPNITVNEIKTTGSEYKANIIRNLCTMKWPKTILTPIASMFREMKLSTEQTTEIINKFCQMFKNIDPMELPPLMFQIFSLCSSANQIMIPIVALQKYFYKHHYKKLYATMNSDTTDYDSIDAFSDKELRETEETILHHLMYCTQYKITENQICAVIRNFSSLPDLILTPFVLSSVLTMSQINRESDVRISSSIMLPLLRNIVKKNEDEKELSKVSSWCRDTFQSSTVDLEQLFTILIDQNNEGKDVVTPGLVNLSFSLLKAKNCPKLNSLGTLFLQKFIKKRFIYCHGIIKKLSDWMIADQEEKQFSDCLTTLSLTDTLTVSECTSSIKYILDFFLWIPGEYAMRMMSFILPLVKISHTIRDAFIDVLKKSMYTQDLHTRQMGVYGFCILLTQLNNNNSRRGCMASGNVFTQQNISGFSLMSQATLADRSNPQRHFDILTLEIIGLLRSCFNQPLLIKQTLYENLSRSVKLNPKLAPHILQFIDSHYRSYFVIDDTDFSIKFERIVRQQVSQKDVEVTDNLGRLMILISVCMTACDKNELVYDLSNLKTLFDTLVERIGSIDLGTLQIKDPVDHIMCQTASQFLEVLQALIYHLLWTSTSSNTNVQQFMKLFKQHRRIIDDVKAMIANNNKKGPKKGAKSSQAETQIQNFTINGTIIKRLVLCEENIWDLPSFERLLRLLHSDSVFFATVESCEQLRSNREFVRYVTASCSAYIEGLRSQPEYKQITHSRRIFEKLSTVTSLVYERCIQHLPKLWNEFDVKTAYLSAECFRQSLLTVQEVFERKFADFWECVDAEANRRENRPVVVMIQEIIEKCMESDEQWQGEPDGKKIIIVLFQCLEIINHFTPHDDRSTMLSYNWLFNFCKSHELKSKELGIVHKLLFAQRQKTHSGAFYNTIAMHLERVLDQIDDDDSGHIEFELKSITQQTSDSCVLFLLNALRKQIEDIEHFILKAKSIHEKVKITFGDDQDACIHTLKAVERSICSQLIHISNALLRLTNTCVPVGSCMDNLVRTLMLMYICLMNLTKHFILRNATVPVSFQSVKFDQLLKVAGKPLSSRIYMMIMYIEANIFDENATRKNHDPKADKAKVLKETKFLPPLIMRIENFNKFVIMLSKKSKAHLVHYLHMGTVRDFRIKTSELKKAIDKTLADSNEFDVDESMLEESEQPPDTEDTDNQEDLRIHISKLPIAHNDVEGISPADSETGIIAKESNSETMDQVLNNLAIVNKKTRKRKSKESIHQTEQPQLASKETSTTRRSKRKKVSN